MRTNLNPRWVAWRNIEGPAAPTYAFMAFICRMKAKYCAARGMRPTDSILDHDDFTAFIEGHVFNFVVAA